MKILRSVNRRGSTIESAGYFTVLRSNTWFPASRLRESFGDLVGRSEETAPPPESKSMLAQKAAAPTDSEETEILSEIIKLSTPNHRPIRTALIVLAAAAITLIMLWWIANP